MTNNNFNNKEEFLAAYKAAYEKLKKNEDCYYILLALLSDNPGLQPAIEVMAEVINQIEYAIDMMRKEGEEKGWLEPYRPRICMHACF